MTTKEIVMKEIEKIPDTEPMLKLILDMLEANKIAIRKTKNGRPIRTQKDMANIDCPYPYEADI
jgi:hypothetical protein